MANKNQYRAPAGQQPAAQKNLANEEARAYLEAAGWQLASTSENGDTTWSDPAGQGNSRTGEKVTGARLPVPDGGEPFEVKQTRCAPAPWDYPLREATKIQSERDRAAAKKATEREPVLA